jgi:hypothetical protein
MLTRVAVLTHLTVTHGCGLLPTVNTHPTTVHCPARLAATCPDTVTRGSAGVSDAEPPCGHITVAFTWITFVIPGS